MTYFPASICGGAGQKNMISAGAHQVAEEVQAEVGKVLTDDSLMPSGE